MMTRYYVKDANNAVYRRADGKPFAEGPPAEVLWPSGWAPLAIMPNPASIVEVDEPEARRVARALGLRWPTGPTR